MLILGVDIVLVQMYGPHQMKILLLLKKKVWFLLYIIIAQYRSDLNMLTDYIKQDLNSYDFFWLYAKRKIQELMKDNQDYF